MLAFLFGLGTNGGGVVNATIFSSLGRNRKIEMDYPQISLDFIEVVIVVVEDWLAFLNVMRDDINGSM